jgi:hypothetical protein
LQIERLAINLRGHNQPCRPDSAARRCRLPRAASVGKGRVEAPKVYVGDSGLLHALPGVPSVQALHWQPVAGPARRGFVVEQVAAAVPPCAQLARYRTAGGSEPDLAVEFAGRWLGIEVRFSAAPKPQRWIWVSLGDLGFDRAIEVALGERGSPLASGVDVVPLWEVGAEVRRWVDGGRARR